MSTIAEHETQQIEAANGTGKTPVVFIHGLWLLPSSWNNWAGAFEEAGYAAVAPVWPDDPRPSRRPEPTRPVRQEDARADRRSHRRGELPLPLSALKSTGPVLKNRSTAARAIILTLISSSTAGPMR